MSANVRISNLPNTTAAAIIDTDIIPIVVGIAAGVGVTSKVTVAELRLELGTTAPAGGRTVSSAATYLSNNAVFNVKDFGAVGNGAIDDTTAIQAAITAALAVAGTAYFPNGSYKTTGALVINPASGIRIMGEGRGSVLIPTAFVGNVFTLTTGSAWPENTLYIADLTIRAVAITAGQNGFGSTNMNGVRMERVYVYKMDVGFWLSTAQFCSFNGISATQCTVGCKVDQGVGSGGGNNNTFLDCWFSYNAVGLFCSGNSIYPMNVNKFINLTTHANAVCAVYLNNLQGFSIENWAPEANGTGAASVVIDGLTIQNSILHCETAMVELSGYVHVSITQNIIANANSRVTISGGSSATVRITCDATSFPIYTDVPFAHASNGATAKEPYALRAPMFFANGQQSGFIVEPLLTESRAFVNDASGDVHRGQFAGGTTSVSAYVFDPQLGSVLSSTFADGTKQLVFVTSPAAYSGLGTRVFCSFMVQSSDSSALWQFDLGQSTANLNNIPLEAGKWYRIILIGSLQFTPRSANVTIKGMNAAAFTASLKTARYHAFTITDPRISALVARENIYNANLQPEGVSVDRGDADVTLVHAADMPIQRFATALTANRTVTLPVYANNTTGNPNKAKYRIVRTGLGAFTLNVGGLKTIPAGTAAYVDVEYSGMPSNGGAWVLTGYGTL